MYHDVNFSGGEKRINVAIVSVSLCHSTTEHDFILFLTLLLRFASRLIPN